MLDRLKGVFSKKKKHSISEFEEQKQPQGDVDEADVVTIAKISSSEK